MAYQIFQIRFSNKSQLEQLGTKQKFWIIEQNGDLVLFKVGRPNTGENWAEKACSELCEKLGVPHATYDLATFDRTHGIISPSFTPVGSQLIHGNELLANVTNNDSAEGNYHSRQHQVSRVMNLMKSNDVKLPLNHKLPELIDSADKVFLGYLMFDALVGNQDRHFENWGGNFGSKRRCVSCTNL